jgi:putative NADH-flavin reductase
MGKAIVVFGAGGRAGRAVVDEARRRGHRVTAVVRDPARYPGLGDGDGGTRVCAGDVTDPVSVAALAAGHDAAVHAAAVYGEGTDPDAFFPAAANALAEGLRTARVPRLVAVGLATLLPGADGVRGVDAASFPVQHRPFSLAHGSGLEALRSRDEQAGLDWVWVAPAGDFDHAAGRVGRYVLRPHADTSARISYADFAIALVDQIDPPAGLEPHHRTLMAVAQDGAGH